MGHEGYSSNRSDSPVCTYSISDCRTHSPHFDSRRRSRFCCSSFVKEATRSERDWRFSFEQQVFLLLQQAQCRLCHLLLQLLLLLGMLLLISLALLQCVCSMLSLPG